MTTDERDLKQLTRVLGSTLGPSPRARAKNRRPKSAQTITSSARRWNVDGNIVGYGIGPKRVRGRARTQVRCLVVFVATKMGQGKLPPGRRIPKFVRTQGGLRIPTDIVEIGGVGELQAVHAGANAAHFSMRAGTVTAIVRSALGGGPLQLLSCAHVFAPLGASGPEVESPPDPLASTKTNVVANVTRAIPLQTGTSVGNRVDAALALPIAGVTSQPGIPGLGPIAAASRLESGQFASNGVRRFVGVGASSGRVQGELLAESVSTLLRDERGRVFRFDDVIAYRSLPLTSAGDSGMPLVRPTPVGLELVGMHIGASVFRNPPIRAAFMVPMSRVLARLGVQLA